MNNDSNGYLLITSVISRKKNILEKLSFYSCGLYQAISRPIKSYVVMNQKFCDPKTFIIWHECLGHLGFSMMCCIINNSFGHPFKNHKILMSTDYNCVVCSQGKLIIRPSFTKVLSKSPTFLEHIQGNICGPIHPPSGPFHYFMVLINASTCWVLCLFSFN